MFPTDYEWADLIDDQDKLRMLIDPTSPYAQNGSLALGRAIDDEVILGAFGVNKTGENGADNTSFLGSNVVAASGTGLTIGKLRAARLRLARAEVDIGNEDLFFAASAQNLDDLLGTTEVTSAEYNTVKALVKGEVDSFMGFKFIQIERLPLQNTNERRCLAWAKTGMHLGIWNDITSRISERDDKSYSTQVYVKGTFGATRVEEAKVVEVDCVEA